MNTTIVNVFIVHRSAFQVSIWQQILQSQGWAGVALPATMNLQQLFLSIEQKNNLSLPSVLLVDGGMSGVDVLEFCEWMRSRPQPIPVVLLAEANHGRVMPQERQAKQNRGAFDFLPSFSEGAIAIEAVNALKCVATALGNVETSNNALVGCIMDLKRSFEAEAKSSPGLDNGSAVSPPLFNVTPTDPQKKDKVRKYRGRDY